MYPDVYFSYATGGLWLIAITAYLVRVARRGGAHSERVTKFGASALVGRGVMDMAYWTIEPVVRGLARLHVTPNGLTWSALVTGLVAAAATGVGWFGLACLLATISTITDILDGQLARLQNVSSNRGELLDAAVDRYTEFALFAGMAIAMRASWWQLGLALAALLASFVISYATAKAEALDVTPPRGLMRRHERAVYTVVGLGSTPLLGPAAARHDLPYVTPLLVALAIVAVVGNVSAVRRFVRIARSLG